MLKKRGLSALVATLIIILLTLVAVGVIWVIINGIVQQGAEQIELGQYTLDLQIKATQIQNGDVTVVVVRRNPGQGNFIGMNFVFSDGQNSEIIRENAVLRELEENRFTFRLTKISTASLKTVSVAPIFETGSGRESVGKVADIFDVPANKSIGAGAEGNFEALGFTGAGKVEYPGSTDKIPDFRNVIINPLDVHLGDNQTFTAMVYSPYNVTEVTTRTQLDNELLILPLEKQPDGSWFASWKVYDTHTNVYRTTFIAKDSAGNENSMTLTWTDPCSGLNHGIDSTILTDCTVGVDQIDGLDTGKVTLATGVVIILNSGSKFAYTPGYSISFSSGASIRFNGTGSLTKQYLFYTDADADSYGASSTYSLGTSASVSGKIRAKDALGTSDCNDASSSVSVTRNQFNDSDGDNYTVAGSSFCASSSTWGNSACTTAGSTYSKNSTNGCVPISSLNGTDCYDLNANARPNQTSYFTSHRGDGSFDYDCVNGQEKQVDVYDSVCNTDTVANCDITTGCVSACSTSNSFTPACGGAYDDFTGVSCVGSLDCNSVNDVICAIGSMGGTCAFSGSSQTQTVACR